MVSLALIIKHFNAVDKGGSQQLKCFSQKCLHYIYLNFQCKHFKKCFLTLKISNAKK